MKNPLDPQAKSLFDKVDIKTTKIVKINDKSYKKRIQPIIKDFLDVRINEILIEINK